MSNNHLPRLFLAICAGASSVLAFAPLGFWPLQIVSLALLLRLTLKADSIKQSAWLGWAYGFGCAVCGLYWLFISMHRYGDMPAWLAAAAVGLFGLYLGIYPALAIASSRWLHQRWSLSNTMTALLVFPTTWALSEWMRGWMLTGFPWLISGYAHTNNVLANFAPLVGVYGLGWITAFLAGCITLFPIKKSPLLLAGALFLTGFALQNIQWSKPHGQAISVRLLQGNVAQDMKFVPENIRASLILYDTMLRAHSADLIATPETAIPIFQQQLPSDYLPELMDFAKKSNSHLVIGIPLRDEFMRYFNSVLHLAPNMATPHYDKHHLVPFGEFIPFGFRWFVNMLHIPLGDFSRGDALQTPFAVKDQWVLPNICYEDLFGEEIAGQLGASHMAGKPVASILLNVSNIAWFGDSIAIPQHLQISQMRALETARPMLRATNTGATAIINAQGKVVQQLPPHTRDTLTGTVQGRSGVTPYILYGNTSILIWCGLMLIIARFSGRQHKT